MALYDAGKGSVPSLPGCHAQARTLDELAVRMQEAIEAYLDSAGEDVVIREFVGGGLRREYT
ncbi:MAG TPA: type II toxin-antitoxin system HicB family antitoxin [Candidatus Hydrogenedentes bacterium]|nr:type II toxin-antitoxin system HicB family antitoxin [Candidatus Hydrogenedentota bacterium]